MSLNSELAGLFSTMAAVMEIKGENAFKALAFAKVSRVIGDMTIDIRQAYEQGTLAEVKGLGESSRRVVEQYIREGKSDDYQELVSSVPAGLLPMLEIPGMGPKTVSLLWKERGITSIEELSAAIDAGKLAGLKGMGEKKIQGIKEGIALLAKSAGRVGIVDGLPLAESLAERLRKLPGVTQVSVCGSLRRRKETIGDVDLVCTVKDPAAAGKVTAAFAAFAEAADVLGQGSTKATFLTASGLQVDLRVVPEGSFGAAVLYFTGSKEHSVRLRTRAQAMDLTLNEWGLYELKAYEAAARKSGEAPPIPPLAGATEADCYEKLGLRYIEPEIREDRGEIEAAESDTLPALIEISDIRGDLHTHTTASDGKASIEKMAEAAIERGYKYLAITDHSKSQVIANGLSAERLLKHVAAIRKAAAKYASQVTLLAGCEVDILADGSLDFDEKILAELDWVVASPHVALKQDSAKATDRLVRAIQTRYVNVIGHPTGRLIGGREGLSPDWAKVFKAAAATGTAMETNAGWPRLDLNDLQARAAIDAGVKLSINTDAHAVDELDGLRWGIDVARRAWAGKQHVINCLSLSNLQTFIATKR